MNVFVAFFERGVVERLVVHFRSEAHAQLAVALIAQRDFSGFFSIFLA